MIYGDEICPYWIAKDIHMLCETGNDFVFRLRLMEKISIDGRLITCDFDNRAIDTAQFFEWDFELKLLNKVCGAGSQPFVDIYNVGLRKDLVYYYSRYVGMTKGADMLNFMVFREPKNTLDCRIILAEVQKKFKHYRCLHHAVLEGLPEKIRLIFEEHGFKRIEGSRVWVAGTIGKSKYVKFKVWLERGE